MKRLVLVGGTMGIGKTTACQIVKKSIPNSVFLDGDWCWDMHPFVVTNETKAMVMNNICFLLNSFLHCLQYETILFCWVMHQQEIIDDILSRLDLDACEVISLSLICDKQVLTARLEKDVDAGIRTKDVIQRAVERISLYNKLDTDKIDVSRLSPAETAEQIISVLARR